MCVGSEVLLVPGTMVEVPDIADADVKLCISSEPDPSSNTIVLAHHIDDPEKLLTYFLDVTNCTTAPAPGSYFFAVFVQKEDKMTITAPTIFFTTVSVSEYDFTVKAFILSTCLIDRFFMKLEFFSHAYDFQLFPTQAFSLHVVKT